MTTELPDSEADDNQIIQTNNQTLVDSDDDSDDEALDNKFEIEDLMNSYQIIILKVNNIITMRYMHYLK